MREPDAPGEDRMNLTGNGMNRVEAALRTGRRFTAEDMAEATGLRLDTARTYLSRLLTQQGFCRTGSEYYYSARITTAEYNLTKCKELVKDYPEGTERTKIEQQIRRLEANRANTVR